MNIVRYKNRAQRSISAWCRRSYNKTHNKHRGYTPLFSALALLLSAIVLGACPDNGDSTPTEFSYTCTNGTAVGGSTAQQSTQDNCTSCDFGYALSGTQCVQALFQFTCENGIGVPTADADAPITNIDCARCNDNYVPYTINGTNRQECAPDTYGRLSNGVTIICPGVAVGGEFDIDGTTYTKRGRDDIIPANAAATCTTGITDMSTMFDSMVAFNEDIGHWDVSDVNNMGLMFNNNFMFNQNIGTWDVSGVGNMGSMFTNAFVFNQDIGNWDVSRVRRMTSMFLGAAAFNQDIGSWDVSAVGSMNGMFNNAVMFNKNIGKWDVSGVTNMSNMFAGASMFNKNIGNWDVSSVTDMAGMFNIATAFNQNISGWCVSGISSKPDSFDAGSALAGDPNHAPSWGATCQ